jgi:ssDNA-binding Zn-finger/Zn-ribbon topoisomerase 1
MSVVAGKFVGSVPPFGYKRKKLAHDSGYTLEEIPEEAEVVRLIYELCTQGEQQPDGTFSRAGTARIATKLNALGIRTGKGNPWTSDYVRSILQNPVYDGMIRWKYRPDRKALKGGEVSVSRPRLPLEECITAEGLHERIVSNETWKLAQMYLKQSAATSATTHKPLQNPFAGIIICGKCGHNMIRKQKAKAGRHDLVCRYPNCDNVSSAVHYVEERVLEALGKWLSGYIITTGTTPQVKSNFQALAQRGIKELDAELQTIATQKSGLHNLVEQGVYSTDMFLERSRELADRQAKTEQDKQSLQNEIAQAAQRETARREIPPRAEEILTIYNAAPTPEIKNNLLKEVLDRVAYTKHISSKKSGDPYAFELELFPKLPK